MGKTWLIEFTLTKGKIIKSQLQILEKNLFVTVEIISYKPSALLGSFPVFAAKGSSLILFLTLSSVNAVGRSQIPV